MHRSETNSFGGRAHLCYLLYYQQAVAGFGPVMAETLRKTQKTNASKACSMKSNLNLRLNGDLQMFF